MSLGKLVMNLIRPRPLDVVEPVQEVGEPGGPAVGLGELVAVDRLAQQGDLQDPLIDEPPGLLDDHAGRSALLGTPRTDGTMQ